MKSRNPKKASLGWVSEIRNTHFFIVLLKLFTYYLAFNFMFSILYYFFGVLNEKAIFFDYIYFSFVTSLSIGYGDFVPLSIVGKVIVIVQTCTAAMYFALIVSVLSVKMFHPRDLIRFLYLSSEYSPIF